MFAGYLYLQFKDGRKIRQINPSQTLMNLQYMEFVDEYDTYWYMYQWLEVELACRDRIGGRCKFLCVIGVANSYLYLWGRKGGC